MDNHNHERNGVRGKWAFWGFAAVAAYFLIAEHKAHLSDYLNYWPLLLVLACPLMHVFMHGGHGGHGSHDPDRDTQSDNPSKGKRS